MNGIYTYLIFLLWLLRDREIRFANMLLQYPMVSLNVRAYSSSSLDTKTHQRLSYTPHRTTPKLPNTPLPSPPAITTTTFKSDIVISSPKQGIFHSYTLSNRWCALFICHFSLYLLPLFFQQEMWGELLVWVTRHGYRHHLR